MFYPRLTVLPVGQGSGNLIEVYEEDPNQNPDANLIYLALVDCGYINNNNQEGINSDKKVFTENKNSIKNFVLNKMKKRRNDNSDLYYMDLFLLTHQDKDHWNLFREILQEICLDKKDTVKIERDDTGILLHDNKILNYNFDKNIKEYYYIFEYVYFDFLFKMTYYKETRSITLKINSDVLNDDNNIVMFECNDDNNDYNIVMFKTYLSNLEKELEYSVAADSSYLMYNLLKSLNLKPDQQYNDEELLKNNNNYKTFVEELKEKKKKKEIKNCENIPYLLVITLDKFIDVLKLNTIVQIKTKFEIYKSVVVATIETLKQNMYDFKKLYDNTDSNKKLKNSLIKKTCYGGINYGFLAENFKTILKIITTNNCFNELCSNKSELLTEEKELNLTVKLLCCLNCNPIKEYNKTISPERNFDNAVKHNASSAVTLWTFSNNKDINLRLLMTGDATVHTMYYLNDIMKIDFRNYTDIIMTAPHHGSDHTSKGGYIKKDSNMEEEYDDYEILKKFLVRVNPLYIVLSTGINSNFHHPGKHFIDSCNSQLDNQLSITDIWWYGFYDERYIKVYGKKSKYLHTSFNLKVETSKETFTPVLRGFQVNNNVIEAKEIPLDNSTHTKFKEESIKPSSIINEQNLSLLPQKRKNSESELDSLITKKHKSNTPDKNTLKR